MKTLVSFLIRFVPRKYLQLVSGIGLKALGFFYRGNNVECPICRHRYRKFLPYGRIKPRENALCPNCQSLERHRLIWLYLEKKTDFMKRKQRVLHIAPEACFMKRFESIHGDGYVTADIESPLAKVKMDIHQIPFDADSFDVVLCNHVLEHVDDDIKAMSEICRVLKGQGYAVLQIPIFSPLPEVTLEDRSITDPREREKAFGQDDHVRKFGKDYPKRIDSSGLTSVVSRFTSELAPDDITRYGLAAGEVLYLGVKVAI
jgi:SAM-dependent methyltransferase